MCNVRIRQSCLVTFHLPNGAPANTGTKKTWHLRTLRIKHRHDDMIGNLCAACHGPQESKIQESRKPADGHKSRGFNGLFNTGSEIFLFSALWLFYPLISTQMKQQGLEKQLITLITWRSWKKSTSRLKSN